LPIAARRSGVMPGAGASSTTFWWRRCTEQSRSNRYTQLPWLSPKTWISMWRGRCRYFSISTCSSPKDDFASRWQEASASANSSPFHTARMPLPPPPAEALISTG
jgi:hypothetical protein